MTGAIQSFYEVAYHRSGQIPHLSLVDREQRKLEKYMPDANTPSSSTPSERLAEQIAERLCREQLIPAKKQAEVSIKIAKGAATQADWRLWLDLPLMQQEAGR